MAVGFWETIRLELLVENVDPLIIHEAINKHKPTNQKENYQHGPHS